MSQMEPSIIAERQYYIALMKIMTNQRSFGVPYFQTNMTGHLMVHWGIGYEFSAPLTDRQSRWLHHPNDQSHDIIYIRHHKAGFRYWMLMDVNGFNCFV